VTEITLEEKFEEERIMDWDGTFVDVLERILSMSGSSSKAQSGSSSRSSSCRGRGEPLPGEENLDGLDVQRDCKKLIVGTLEQIVASVARKRSSLNPEPSKLRSLELDGDSTLREGIQKWFDEVEAKGGGDITHRKEVAKEATDLVEWTAPAKEEIRSEGTSAIPPLPTSQPESPRTTVSSVAAAAA
jgi:hypothetical protein